MLIFVSDKKPKWPPIDKAMLIDQLVALLSDIQILSFAKYFKNASVMVFAPLWEKKLFVQNDGLEPSQKVWTKTAQREIK